MKKSMFYLLILPILFSSCATIIGGSKYTAFVNVDGAPRAQVSYNGEIIGNDGTAVVKIPRKTANRITFKVSQDGCDTQKFEFTKRKVRPWTILGSIALAPSYSSNPDGSGLFIIPIWNVLDIATGSIYKPDQSDPKIVKGDYKTFYYNLPYKCDVINEIEPYENSSPSKKSNVIENNSFEKNSKELKLIELKELFDKGMITEEEYKKSRQAILAQ